MSTQSRQSPSKSSLSIALTEPFVILRTADVSGSPLLGEFSPPSVLRGLLALDLPKPTKISSIQIELQAMSYTSWTEGMFYVHSSFNSFITVSGMGTPGERKLFSATQIFFRAASSPSSGRSLSVEPGVSRNQHQQPPPPLPPPPPEAETALPVPAYVHVAGDASQRGRMRVRRRSSADNLVFQRDPIARVNRPLAASPLSFPPTTEEEVTPTSAHFVESPSASTSFPLVETPVSARAFHLPTAPTTLLNLF
jgi:arrestin-related trafficking adapter 3/6